MRRSALLYVLAGVALFTAGCSSGDQTPGLMEPPAELAPDTQSSLRLRCRDNGLIVLQLAAILSPRPPARLYQQAVVKFGLMEAARLTRRKALAQARALDLIDFLADNRANLINPNTQLTLTRLTNVIDAILCIVDLDPSGVVLGPTTGIGVVPANNPTPVLITTPQGTSGIRVPIGGAPSQDVNGNTIPGVVVTVTELGTSSPLNTPLDKYGQTVDLTASEEVLWEAGGVTVAICVTADDAIFDRLRLGHEGGAPDEPKFGAIEILTPPENGGEITEIVGSCGTPPPPIGSRQAFEGLREFAKRVLLPQPAFAAVLAAKSGGVGGTTRKFSKFGAVDPELALVALPTSTSGIPGEPVAQPPSVLVRTQTLNTPIPDITVNFVVPAGSPGTITPGSVTTSSSGVAATTSWVLGAGQNTVNATGVPPVTEITFVPATVTFTAVGALPPPDFGASNWSYRVSNIVPESDDWATLPWPVTASGWAQATAPFGSVPLNGTSPNGCDDKAPTVWGVNSVIQLRRDFYVPVGTTSASITVQIDNDTRVFLNGTELTDGPRPHEGCAKINPLTPLTVNAGSESALIVGAVNKLAVLGVDRGGESFIDVKVTLSP